MKKTVSLLLSLLLLALAVSAGAESPLTAFCDSEEKLLFDTTNVTLTGKAEFSLDGEWFKTAEIRYMQDGENSFWKLDLTGPRSDGELIRNGYTVVANGERYFVMEVFYPGTYKPGTDTAQTTLLRRTVQLDRMMDLVRLLADEAGSLLGGDAISASAVGDTKTAVRIALDGDVPPLANTALNLLYQYAAKRYFHVDYDHVEDQHIVPMDYYFTVTQGILSCTKSVALKKLDVVMQEGADGLPERIAGEAAVMLSTGADGDRLLEVSFELDVSDVGSSTVKEFNPADYGVMMPEPEETAAAQELSEEEAAGYVDAARKIWAESGCGEAENMAGTARLEDGYSYVVLTNPEETARLSCIADPQGKVLELHNEINEWQQADVEFIFGEYPDENVNREAVEKVMQYLENIAPELLEQVNAMKTQWWVEYNGQTVLCMMEDPIAQDWDGVMVVIRVQPDWRVEYFSRIANG